MVVRRTGVRVGCAATLSAPTHIRQNAAIRVFLLIVELTFVVSRLTVTARSQKCQRPNATDVTLKTLVGQTGKTRRKEQGQPLCRLGHK